MFDSYAYPSKRIINDEITQMTHFSLPMKQINIHLTILNLVSTGNASDSETLLSKRLFALRTMFVPETLQYLDMKPQIEVH